MLTRRISNAGYHPDFSLLLFPSCCPGDQWHVAAGGCRCLPASHWSSRSADHMLTSNKGFVLKTIRLSWLISTLIFIMKSFFFFFLQYDIVCLSHLFSLSSPPSLPSVSTIMLLSKSLVSVCSLAELIFGWYYITAPLSSQCRS